MTDRIRVMYVRERGSDRWDLWFAVSEASWEAGGKFPNPAGDGCEVREIWIDVDPDQVREVLNLTGVVGTPNV